MSEENKLQEFTSALEQYRELIMQINSLYYNQEPGESIEDKVMVLQNSLEDLEAYLVSLWNSISQDNKDQLDEFVDGLQRSARQKIEKLTIDNDDPVTLIQLEETLESLNKASEPKDYLWPLALLLSLI